MMQTSNVLDCYLKLSNNHALIFQIVSLFNRKKEPAVFQGLGIQLPGLLKSFSTQYENSVGICIFGLPMSKSNFKEDVRKQKSSPIYSNIF